MKLFGKKALIDNIDKINKVELENKDSQIISLLKEHNIQFEIKGTKFFSLLDKNLNHQGIISYADNKIGSLEDIYNKTNAIVLIVDELQDPQNFGAILRTCDAFGVDAVIYKKDNQVQINDFVIKSSMGAINNLNLFKVTNLSNEIELLKKNGF
jgi:23S rRNA (guanosine2251-2'-O)-methyltransferase